MTDQEIKQLYFKKEYHNWELFYIYEGEVRITYYRSKTLWEAINWLDKEMGISTIIDAGLADEGSWRTQDA